MQVKLKRLSDQTIVITGATSGIGLCTARLAAERGANVVAVARRYSHRWDSTRRACTRR